LSTFFSQTRNRHISGVVVKSLQLRPRNQ